jgi:flagella basal body P-ring formation protein FlgA
MIRNLIVATAALLSLATPAKAQTTAALEHPVLRSQATITEDVVRIGDLVDHAGIVAKVAIFRAPDLGTTGTVPAERVVEAVRAHAIVGLDTAGISEVTVTRASRAFQPSAIEAILAQAISAQYAFGPAKDIVLNFDRELRAVHAEPGSKGEPRIARVSFDARSGRFDATLDIPGQNALRLTGRAVATIEVVTLARAVGRGETLKHADLVVERRPRTQPGTGFVSGIDQAAGLAARNALQTGAALRTADLMKPEIVQRNEVVTLIYEVPGITLTVRGKALDGGTEGDTIAVMNEQSKRMVQGTVIGPGRVYVGNATPKIAANLEPKSADDDNNAR